MVRSAASPYKGIPFVWAHLESCWGSGGGPERAKGGRGAQDEEQYIACQKRKISIKQLSI